MATSKNTKEKKAPVKRTSKAKAAPMAAGEHPIYSMTGASVGAIKLPDDLFGTRWNADLVHQVVTGMQANARPITAHTKNRGEVRGGGKKPWKQKGTGRARHGSSRSPIWRGGGITHGPRAERVFEVKINKKMRRAALLSVLSRKAKDGEIILVESFSFAEPKTSTAKSALMAIAKSASATPLVAKTKNAALIAFLDANAMGKKSFRNIGNVETEEVRNINPVDLMTHKYLVIENPAKAFAALSARLGK